MNKSDTSANGNPYRRTLLRRQQSRDTRAAIVRAAARVWAEKGFEQATVDDICDAAGVARSTYYFHFATTDQVLSELTWATAGGTAADID
ncbi:MAG TPA: helix-turn-helix domain-containing protein, partial [Acidimicrobiales bacterium]|nr:helix-turn-helix domain-containing protein [Acidimicrobiales bacterium]